MSPSERSGGVDTAGDRLQKVELVGLASSAVVMLLSFIICQGVFCQTLLRPAKPQGGPDGDAQALKGIFRSLKDSVTAPNKSLGAGRVHELEGIFQKLTDPEQFRRTVMPGLPEDERKDAPSSLQVLIYTCLLYTSPSPRD